MQELLTLDYTKDGLGKQIHVLEGDLSDTTEHYDLLVCSAFKSNYVPIPGSAIETLYTKEGIDVCALSEDPEMDLRDMGCWLSKRTERRFSRIACVEILSLTEANDAFGSTDKLLTSTFSTLRFLCDQADLRSIPLRRIIMPILGAGQQNIDINYVAPALLSQMIRALDSIDQLTDIYILERDHEKALRFTEILSLLYENKGTKTPDVFISYSSKQEKNAHQIQQFLAEAGIVCWIAPESISPGSSYIEEISQGIGMTKATLLVLTPDAESSRWVRKEVGASIGAGHIIIPYQNEPYEIGSSFRFLLDGEQIFEAWKQNTDALTALRYYS